MKNPVSAGALRWQAVRRLSPIAGVLACVICLSADPAAEKSWTSLFDGSTLNGWHVSAKPQDREKGFWKIQDGTITCDSRGNKNHDYVWLVSDREFADFDLKLKVRGFRESTGNSGIQVRSRYDNREFWMDGPQVDIHPPAPWRTGLIYDETRETRRWIFPSLKNWDIDATQGPSAWKWRYSDEDGGWNDLEISCAGTRITTRLNSLTVADLDGAGILDDESHRRHSVGLRGHLALQLHMRDDLFIQFKDIYIR